jgi:hypothetical protein
MSEQQFDFAAAQRRVVRRELTTMACLAVFAWSIIRTNAMTAQELAPWCSLVMTPVATLVLSTVRQPIVVAMCGLAVSVAVFGVLVLCGLFVVIGTLLGGFLNWTAGGVVPWFWPLVLSLAVAWVAQWEKASILVQVWRAARQGVRR